MELDELKSAWQSTNQRLDEVQSRQIAMLRSHQMERRAHLWAEPAFELIVAMFTVFWSGGFLWDNIAKFTGHPAAAVPAVLIFALSIFTISLSIRQIVLISTFDFSEPILETQRKLGTLRSIRVRSTQFVFLAGLGLWMIFPIFAAQSVLGLEFVSALNSAWLFGNVAFGAVTSIGIVLAARKFGGQSKVFKAVNEIFAGTQVTHAQAMLDELAQFEQG